MYRQHYPNDPGMHNMSGSMGGDSMTHVTYTQNQSFLQRIGNSLIAILVGIALLFAGTGLLFWNEGRAVQTAQSLDEGLRVVIPLHSFEMPFEENEKKLVHLTGPLSSQNILRDDLYGVSVHAIKLKRTVDMYQWVEHESKKEYEENGEKRTETTYSYSTEWRSERIRSSDFYNTVGHHNPETFSVESKELIADSPHLGGFRLSKLLTEKINKYENLPITKSPHEAGTVLSEGKIFHSTDPRNPKVGDLRVSFSYAGLSGYDDTLQKSAETVSVIARQFNRGLHKYQTEAGDDLEMLYYGKLSAREIFGREQAANAFLTWAVRGGGWLLMFIGMGCVSQIFLVLVGWIPIVRDLVAMGITMANLALSISLSLTVIALGWIRYRPLLGCTLLAVACLPFLISKLRASRQSSSRDRHV